MSAKVTTSLTSTHSEGLYISRSLEEIIEAISGSGHAYQDIAAATLTEVKPTVTELVPGTNDLICITNLLENTTSVELGKADDADDYNSGFSSYCIIALAPGQLAIFHRNEDRAIWAYSSSAVKIETIVITV